MHVKQFRTVKEEQILKVFEDKVLRKIFRLERSK